jgi:hypothetical protein
VTPEPNLSKKQEVAQVPAAAQVQVDTGVGVGSTVAALKTLEQFALYFDQVVEPTFLK